MSVPTESARLIRAYVTTPAQETGDPIGPGLRFPYLQNRIGLVPGQGSPWYPTKAARNGSRRSRTRPATATTLARFIQSAALDRPTPSAAANSEPLPPKVAARVTELAGLGFRPIGELESRFPGQNWQHAWALLDASGYVLALVWPRRPVALTTEWADGSFVVTVPSFPVMRDRRTLRGWIIRGPSGAQALYRRHLEQAQLSGANRSAPRWYSSMADVVAVTATSVGATRDFMRNTWLQPSALAMTAGLLLLMIVLILIS